MSDKILKPKKDSLIPLTIVYCNNNDACISFFIRAKWPTGFFCEKYGCHHYYFISSKHALECNHCKKQHYLLTDIISQDNKLPLYKLILGLYLFFSSNKRYTL